MGPEAGIKYGNQSKEIVFPKLFDRDSGVIRKIEYSIDSLRCSGRRVGNFEMGSHVGLFHEGWEKKYRNAELELHAWLIDNERMESDRAVIWSLNFSEEDIKEFYPRRITDHKSGREQIEKDMEFFLSSLGFSLADALKQGVVRNTDIEVGNLALSYLSNKDCKSDFLTTACRILASQGKVRLFSWRDWFGWKYDR